MKFQQFPNRWMLKSQNRRSYVVAASRVEGRRQPVSPFATARQRSTQGRSVRRPQASAASGPQPGTQHDHSRARRAAAGLGNTTVTSLRPASMDGWVEPVDPKAARNPASRDPAVGACSCSHGGSSGSEGKVELQWGKVKL
jgi:hypothetical protein